MWSLLPNCGSEMENVFPCTFGNPFEGTSRQRSYDASPTDFTTRYSRPATAKGLPRVRGTCKRELQFSEVMRDAAGT